MMMRILHDLIELILTVENGIVEILRQKVFTAAVMIMNTKDIDPYGECQ